MLLEKLCKKSPLQYGKIIFPSKVIPLFLPKCSNFHHSEMYTIYGVYHTLNGNTVDFLAYMVETVGKKEKKKKTAKHGEMRWTPKQ